MNRAKGQPRDPGDDFFTKCSPDQAMNHALDQLRNLDYTVALAPKPSAA